MYSVAKSLVCVSDLNRHVCINMVQMYIKFYGLNREQSISKTQPPEEITGANCRYIKLNSILDIIV